jgi:hypothetical protein
MSLTIVRGVGLHTSSLERYARDQASDDCPVVSQPYFRAHLKSYIAEAYAIRFLPCIGSVVSYRGFFELSSSLSPCFTLARHTVQEHHRAGSRTRTVSLVGTFDLRNPAVPAKVEKPHGILLPHLYKIPP